MALSDVYFWQDDKGQSPVVADLLKLRRKNWGAYIACRQAIERLEAEGEALRRPQADYVREGIYELRVRWGKVQYRLLYFFHGRHVAILAHYLVKEGERVPVEDMKRAINRKNAYEASPEVHRRKTSWRSEVEA